MKYVFGMNPLDQDLLFLSPLGSETTSLNIFFTRYYLMNVCFIRTYRHEGIPPLQTLAMRHSVGMLSKNSSSSGGPCLSMYEMAAIYVFEWPAYNTKPPPPHPTPTPHNLIPRG